MKKLTVIVLISLTFGWIIGHLTSPDKYISDKVPALENANIELVKANSFLIQQTNQICSKFYEQQKKLIERLRPNEILETFECKPSTSSLQFFP